MTTIYYTFRGIEEIDEFIRQVEVMTPNIYAEKNSSVIDENDLTVTALAIKDGIRHWFSLTHKAKDEELESALLTVKSAVTNRVGLTFISGRIWSNDG